MLSTNNIMSPLMLLELGKYALTIRTKRESEILKWASIVLFLQMNKLVA